MSIISSYQCKLLAKSFLFLFFFYFNDLPFTNHQRPDQGATPRDRLTIFEHFDYLQTKSMKKETKENCKDERTGRFLQILQNIL